MLGQFIPQTDGVGEERAFHQVGAAGWNMKLIDDTSCFGSIVSWFLLLEDELVVRNMYQFVGNAVHHGDLGDSSALFERVPTKCVEHGGNTAFPGVVVHHIPCCPVLDRFNLVNSFLGRWRPYTTSILCYWLHKGVITAGLHITGRGAKVATKEAKGLHTLLVSVVNMFVPRQLVVELNTNVFGRGNYFQWVAMDGIE